MLEAARDATPLRGGGGGARGGGGNASAAESCAAVRRRQSASYWDLPESILPLREKKLCLV